MVCLGYNYGVSAPRPVPGAPVSGHVLAQSVNGTCPTCAGEVLWVRNQTLGSDGSSWHAPLEAESVEIPLPPHLVYVAVSSSGAAAAVTPRAHVEHVCPEDAVQDVLSRVGSMGFYTAEVLAIPCPVSGCRSAPGMLCINARQEALPRPHGARKVSAERLLAE